MPADARFERVVLPHLNAAYTLARYLVRDEHDALAKLALQDVLAHIAVWEPHIKALYAFDPDGARAVAKASTERWQKDEPTGLLDGVPVTIKDNIATKGVPVPLGAATATLVPSAVDAPPAARLREAGAVIFSKTTMPDYGMLSSGLSSFHPLTRNPWDLSKNPGGSSSGAGAAGAGRERSRERQRPRRPQRSPTPGRSPTRRP